MNEVVEALGTVVVDELSTICTGSEFCTEVRGEETVAVLPEDVAETLGFSRFCKTFVT